jgi:hypothetical protein
VGLIILLGCRWFIIPTCNIHCNSLPGTLVNEMGPKLLCSFLFPILKTGITFANLQFETTTPVFSVNE